MFDREKFAKYMEICERAEQMGICRGDRTTALMDVQSADLAFELRLDEWLAAEKFDFAHDFLGIQSNIVRDCFPSKDFGLFVPRFSGYAVHIQQQTTFAERYDLVIASGKYDEKKDKVEALAQLIYANDRSRDKEDCLVQALEEYENMTGAYWDPTHEEYAEALASII